MNPSSNHGSMRATRYAWLTLLLLAAALPFVIFGAVKALKSTSNDPRQWLPRSFEETSKYDRFQEHFGSDEIAVVSWPGCTLDDSRVPTLAKALSDSAFFDRVLTGEVVLRELIDSSIEETRRAAAQDLDAVLGCGDDHYLGAADHTLDARTGFEFCHDSETSCWIDRDRPDGTADGLDSHVG